LIGSSGLSWSWSYVASAIVLALGIALAGSRIGRVLMLAVLRGLMRLIEPPSDLFLGRAGPWIY